MTELHRDHPRRDEEHTGKTVGDQGAQHVEAAVSIPIVQVSGERRAPDREAMRAHVRELHQQLARSRLCAQRDSLADVLLMQYLSMHLRGALALVDLFLERHGSAQRSGMDGSERVTDKPAEGGAV